MSEPRNRTKYGYDANGNMTNDGVNTLVYDAENRATSSSGSLGSGTYTYDGNGLRVEKLSGGTTTVYVFAGSKVIAEYVNGAAPSSPTREYIYSGGTLIAKIESGATQYYHEDHLSVRLMTDASGNVLGQQGHYPHGQSWYAQNTTTKWTFTSYERDAESGNDYAMARQGVNRLGRFGSPDPLAGGTGNPQSLNKYSYVTNDPINLADPTGMNLMSLFGGGGGGGGGCDSEIMDCGEDLPGGGGIPVYGWVNVIENRGDWTQIGTMSPPDIGGPPTLPVNLCGPICIPANPPSPPPPPCSSVTLDDLGTFWLNGMATPEQVDAFFQSTNAPASWDGYDAAASFIAQGINPGLAVGIIGAETSFGNNGLSATNLVNPFSCAIGSTSNFNASASCAANTVAHDERITTTPTTPLSALENGANPLNRVYSETQPQAWLQNVNNWFRRFAKFLGDCQ